MVTMRGSPFGWGNDSKSISGGLLMPPGRRWGGADSQSLAPYGSHLISRDVVLSNPGPGGYLFNLVIDE
jgi:hypothetical protein